MSVLEQLEVLFKKGEISRRDFLTRVSALGLTAAISPVLFSGTARAAVPQEGRTF